MHTPESKRLPDSPGTAVQFTSYQEMVDRLDGGVLHLDLDGIVTLCNLAAGRLLEEDPAAVVGGALGQLLGEQDRTWFDEVIQERSASEVRVGDQEGAHGEVEDRRLARELTLRDVRGDTRVLDLSLRSLRGGWVCSLEAQTGEQGAILHIRHDARLEAVSRLAGRIAHDFNNLLTVIGGNLDLIQTSLADQPQERLSDCFKDAFSALETGADLMGHLQLLSSDQSIRTTRVDVGASVRGFLAQVAADDPAGPTIQVDLADGLCAEVDDRIFRGALLNVLANAREAMGSGGSVMIRARSEELNGVTCAEFGDVCEGSYVVVELEDDGRGISDEDLLQVTDPFFTSKPGGSGLGLSMVKEFALRVGGGVRIRSALGEGTQVAIALPRVQAEPGGTPDPDEAWVKLSGSETVLVVEDEANVRNYAERILRGMGYEVHVAADGPEAVGLLEGSMDIDLVFSDIVMPGGISGHEVAEAAEAGRGPATAILLTSGFVAADLGGIKRRWEFIRKPYTARELGRSIRRQLDSRPIRAASGVR